MTGLVLLAALATRAQELKTATTHPIQNPRDDRLCFHIRMDSGKGNGGQFIYT